MQKFHNCFFFSAFSFSDSRNSMEREGTIFIPPYHFYCLTNIQTLYLQFCIRDSYFLVLITALVLARLLHNEIYQPLEISNFNLLVDIMPRLITAVSRTDRWWTWLAGSRQLLSYNYKRNDYPRKLTKFESQNQSKFE